MYIEIYIIPPSLGSIGLAGACIGGCLWVGLDRRGFDREAFSTWLYEVTICLSVTFQTAFTKCDFYISYEIAFVLGLWLSRFVVGILG